MNKRMLGLLLAAVLLSGLISGLAETVEITPEPDLLATFTYAVVGTPGGPLNMRKAGRLSSPIIAEIPNGATIAVLSRDESWCEVSYNGITAYVTDKYLNFITELPYEQLEKGSFGPAVVALKERMQALGYFRAGAAEMTIDFSITTEDRVKLFEAANGLEPTGIATPELQAFIFWGPAIPYTQPLPTAVYVTVPGATPTPTTTAHASPTPTPTPGFPTKHP
jgi:hypothetical protein